MLLLDSQTDPVRLNAHSDFTVTPLLDDGESRPSVTLFHKGDTLYTSFVERADVMQLTYSTHLDRGNLCFVRPLIYALSHILNISGILRYT